MPVKCMLLFTRPQTTWDKNPTKMHLCKLDLCLWVSVCVYFSIWINPCIWWSWTSARNWVPVSTLSISNHFVSRKRNADHVTIHFFVVVVFSSMNTFLSTFELSSVCFMIGVFLCYSHTFYVSPFLCLVCVSVWIRFI